VWIDEASDEILRLWMKHSPTMKLVSTIDGQILWANAAFCEWSQYTLGELRRMTWQQISVPDKNLEADIDEAKRLDSYNPTYTIKKQYIPKGQAPEWGQLTVMRYPLTSEIQCCLCTWEPLKNGTAKAFAMAMEHSQSVDKKISEMTAELQKLTNQSDEDKFVLGTIRLIQRHPRLAMAFLVVAASVFGLNNIVELLQRTGFIHLPVKIEPAKTGETAHVIPVSEVAAIPVSYLREFKTGKWSLDFESGDSADGRNRPMFSIRGQRDAEDVGSSGRDRILDCLSGDSSGRRPVTNGSTTVY